MKYTHTNMLFIIIITIITVVAAAVSDIYGIKKTSRSQNSKVNYVTCAIIKFNSKLKLDSINLMLNASEFFPFFIHLISD